MSGVCISAGQEPVSGCSLRGRGESRPKGSRMLVDLLLGLSVLVLGMEGDLEAGGEPEDPPLLGKSGWVPPSLPSPRSRVRQNGDHCDC